MKTPKSMKSELDGLAHSILKKAMDDTENMETKIDAFKAVSAYYLGTQRVTKGRDTGDEGKASFTDILQKAKGPPEKRKYS